MRDVQNVRAGEQSVGGRVEVEAAVMVEVLGNRLRDTVV
jgi:hypothetical protein